MDIAKIRKKAKEQTAERRPEEKGPAATPEASGIPAAAQLSSIPSDDTVSEEPLRSEPEETVRAVKAPEPPAGSQSDSEPDTHVELLTFALGTEEFAFKVEEVEEILRLQKITYVPTMPRYVIGITSLRGKIIPVIDLKDRLGLRKSDMPAYEIPHDSAKEAKESKILIIAGPKGFIGAIIDRVIGVVEVAKNSLLEPPAHLTEAELKYIEGIVILDKRFISAIRTGETMDIEIG